MMKLTMTSINRNNNGFKRSLSTLGLTLLVMSISACGGKKVATSDNSVEYKTAQALPPLKKPSRVVVTPKNATDISATEVGSNSASLATDEAAEPVIEDQVINASVVSAKSGEARLEVEASFDQAWDYLSSSLQKSDLTVFSRNKEAGRFAIGCGDFAAAPTVVKSGRWSFFNRSKQENLEHCALQVVQKRKTAVVSVLNRAGEEVSGEYSNQLFNRILNN